MKKLKHKAILLSMLLVAMVMVSMASATEQGLNEKNSVDVGKALNAPEHYIPPEYFKDAKPATPLPESKMITIQANQPVTDHFIATTNPVIDEWARETGGTWRKPREVWSYNENTPDKQFVHIDWARGGSNNQDLITRSYLDYRWA